MKFKIIREYNDFFKRLGIDKKGILMKDSNLKFATYPYIGSNYGKAKKIFFIGLDIGSDEKLEGFQTFEERRKAIEDKKIINHNPHIAGTYIFSLYFLKDDKNWTEFWNNIKNKSSCQRALKERKLLPNDNPLSYIALTNFYKFVTVNRTKRTGALNRNYRKKEIEEALLLNEIEFLKPDIIIFQSKQFLDKKYKKFLHTIKKLINGTIYIGLHPSHRGNRSPKYLIKHLKRVE